MIPNQRHTRDELRCKALHSVLIELAALWDLVFMPLQVEIHIQDVSGLVIDRGGCGSIPDGRAVGAFQPVAAKPSKAKLVSFLNYDGASES